MLISHMNSDEYWMPSFQVIDSPEQWTLHLIYNT